MASDAGRAVERMDLHLTLHQFRHWIRSVTRPAARYARRYPLLGSAEIPAQGGLTPH
jgi:hypothetical protein